MMFPRALVLAACAAAAGCIVPNIENPFDNPGGSLVVVPEVVDPGVSEIEVIDEARRLDFRTVWEVDDAGDFVVRDWASNEDELLVEIDVFDDAFGEQELVIELEDGDVLYVPFDVR